MKQREIKTAGATEKERESDKIDRLIDRAMRESDKYTELDIYIYR